MTPVLSIIYKWALGPGVVVSTAAFHARVRGSAPGLGDLKETKMFLPHPRVNVSIVGSLRDREVACSASDRQGSNFESCVWRTVSTQSSHHPQEVLLAQLSLYVHKVGLKPDSFLSSISEHMKNTRRCCLGSAQRYIIGPVVRCSCRHQIADVAHGYLTASPSDACVPCSNPADPTWFFQRNYLSPPSQCD